MRLLSATSLINTNVYLARKGLNSKDLNSQRMSSYDIKRKTQKKIVNCFHPNIHWN